TKIERAEPVSYKKGRFVTRAFRLPRFSGLIGKRGACSVSYLILSKNMSEHKTTLTWKRGDTPFEYQKYSRDHTWKFEGGHEMQASAAPAYLGNPKLVDPEEALWRRSRAARCSRFLPSRPKRSSCSMNMSMKPSVTWKKMRKADWRLRV